MTDNNQNTTAQPQDQPRKTFDYLVVTIDEFGMYKTDRSKENPPDEYNHNGFLSFEWEPIAALGELGWELVQVAFFYGRDGSGTGFFKRCASASNDGEVRE